ncbi:MAG: bifunctional phosphoribosylaminoimidazolecarboxamide formyltransferase/IMP cyclohydrolase [Methanomassiliicoccales archaeon]|nr:MAG: bifunctional phosphoribosylaminoimidazolecarboxamide formyltransferase/IMP cyclohydrolase [Methanomassiliicoccales archaeon]
MRKLINIRRALISVSDKNGIVEFAQGLTDHDVEILSTGGTAKLLKEKGVPVTLVSEYTKFPEMLNGRVKTLHPAVHGGILAIRNSEEHMSQLEEHGITPIDMVVVNLYPFEQTIKKKDVSVEEAVENIDIGGPTMIRSAAKNHNGVAVVVNPGRYNDVLEELKSNGGGISAEFSSKLALEAFEHTAKYDSVISDYLQKIFTPTIPFPEVINLGYEKAMDLRYGENPHQKAAFYKNTRFTGVCVGNAQKLHGKELSFNNIIDLDSALDIVMDFTRPTSSVIKHTNPCGVASAETISEAYIIAEAADSLSAFGSVVGLNRDCDLATAEEIKKHFVEAVIAPDFHPDALSLLSKKKSIRLLKTGTPIIRESPVEHKVMKVKGGLLIQTGDFPDLKVEELKVVTEKKPTEAELKTMVFAWKVLKHVKSNSILLAQGERTVGIGAGQMSRVDASMIAARKAKEAAKGSVMASDAFFPFRDGVDAAAKVGVSAIIQPGGSVRDEEVIAAANEHGMSMVFSGVRLFKH